MKDIHELTAAAQVAAVEERDHSKRLIERFHSPGYTAVPLKTETAGDIAQALDNNHQHGVDNVVIVLTRATLDQFLDEPGTAPFIDLIDHEPHVGWMLGRAILLGESNHLRVIPRVAH